MESPSDAIVSCKSLSISKIKVDEFMTARGEIEMYCSSINAQFISITCIILK